VPNIPYGALRTMETSEPDNQARFDAIFQRAGIGIALLDRGGHVRTANPALLKFLRLEQHELLGRHFTEITYPDDIAEDQGLWNRVMRGEIDGYHVEKRYVRSDGALVWGDLTVTLVPGLEERENSTLGFVQDITDRKSAEASLRLAEEKLLQAQKMEAIGRLAGGVAHDFNNFLTVIAGYGAFLQDSLEATDERRNLVAEILTATSRASELTKQLLAFSRTQILQPKLIDLNEVVVETEKMLCRLIGEDITLKTALATDIGWVRADHGQMQQILLNLAINARDAMPQGGVLTISTFKDVLDEVATKRFPGLKPGLFVGLSVSDTGSGMSEAVQTRLFEPFFTTKEVGRGTGLGLWVVYGILMQSGGGIEVKSEVGHGSTFRMLLPRVERSEFDAATAAGPSAGPHEVATILLVEDQDNVRNLVSMVLERAGFKVLQAGTPLEATTICREYKDQIDLLLTDVVMPEMSGRGVAEAVLAMRPRVCVLYISGYTDDSVIRHGLDTEQIAFIPKPFSPQALTAKVNEVLKRRRGI
jgi:two-component system cell cycle sensor histidine kinase/response regulator CckA